MKEVKDETEEQTYEKNTWYYAKIFLLMIIPVYGLFFSLLLAFSDDTEHDLKLLAKGALIARGVVIILFLILLAVGVIYILPSIEKFIMSFRGIRTLFR